MFSVSVQGSSELIRIVCDHVLCLLSVSCLITGLFLVDYWLAGLLFEAIRTLHILTEEAVQANQEGLDGL